MVPQPLSLPNRLFGLTLTLAAAACQGELTLPADGSPFRLSAVSGFGQQGTVGTELPDPLVARVVDLAGRPVRDVSLRFDTEVPGARLEPSEVVTDDSGKATVRVRLGSTEGTQTFEALLADHDVSGLRTTFDLVALAKDRQDDGDEKGEEDGHHGDGDHDDGHNHDDDRED